MNKEQTAVEYLVEQLNEIMGLTNFVFDSDEDYKKEILSVIQQAKEMFEQQIIDSYEVAYMDGYNDNGKDGKQHYNETFNK
jgi:hypothetical protein